MKSLKVAFVGFVVLFLAPEGAFGQTLWTAGSGNWNKPSNWSLGVPNSGSGTTFDAVIENGGTAQLTSSGASVRRLRVGRAAGKGTLIVDAGGSLTVTENFHLDETGVPQSSVQVLNGGTVTSPATVVGYSAGFSESFSTFVIAGAGSTVNATTSFIIGRAGEGVLRLNNGGLLNLGGGALPLQIATLSNSFGALTIGNGGPAGTLQASAIQFGAGNGQLFFNQTDDLTFAIPISGAGFVAQSGTGTTTLSGTNSYTCGTLIDGGTLAVSADANLGSAPVAGFNLFLDGGTLRATNSFTLAANRKLSVGELGGTISVDATKTLTYPTPYTLGTTTAVTATKSGAGKLQFASNLDVNSGGASEIVVHEGELQSGPLGLGANGGRGAITVENGALLRTGAALIGQDILQSGDGTGTATVTGLGSAWLVAGNVTLAGPRGDGILNVAEGGAVSVNGGAGTVTLVTAGVGARGIINIGTGGAPGSLLAGSISTDTANADGTINFNHTGLLNFSVPISGSARVNKLSAGTTTLSGAQLLSGVINSLACDIRQQKNPCKPRTC